MFSWGKCQDWKTEPHGHHFCWRHPTSLPVPTAALWALPLIWHMWILTLNLWRVRDHAHIHSCTKLVPLGVQQHVTGPGPLKGHLCTLFTHTRSLQHLKGTLRHLLGVYKVQSCPFKGTAPVKCCCIPKGTIVVGLDSVLQNSSDTLNM